MGKTVIGVMGPGEGATATEVAIAYDLGYQIAGQGWVLLTGGRAAGVMAAANQGAQAAGGLTVGILPGSTPEGLCAAVDIPIFTGLGHARNAVNVLSSQVVVACGLGAGTASEIALALKMNKPVILLHVDQAAQQFFQHLTAQPVRVAETVAIAIQQIAQVLSS